MARMAMAQSGGDRGEPHVTEGARIWKKKKKQQPLLHYGGPSRLSYFNLALKGDDAATRVNALSLERKNCPDEQLERSAA